MTITDLESTAQEKSSQVSHMAAKRKNRRVQ